MRGYDIATLLRNVPGTDELPKNEERYANTKIALPGWGGWRAGDLPSLMKFDAFYKYMPMHKTKAQNESMPRGELAHDN